MRLARGPFSSPCWGNLWRPSGRAQAGPNLPHARERPPPAGQQHYGKCRKIRQHGSSPGQPQASGQLFTAWNSRKRVVADLEYSGELSRGSARWLLLAYTCQVPQEHFVSVDVAWRREPHRSISRHIFERAGPALKRDGGDDGALTRDRRRDRRAIRKSENLCLQHLRGEEKKASRR